MQGERVLVVARADFFGGNWPAGFSPLTAEDATSLVARFEALAWFADRPEAEQNPAWKQLIPYCAVTRGREVFCVQRLAAQSERRLHGLLSIGIGGHIDPGDGPTEGSVRRGLLRELHEELVLPSRCPPPVPVGLLVNDADAVGRVHAGIVHRLDLPAGTTGVEVRETGKMAGGFVPLTAVIRGTAGPCNPPAAGPRSPAPVVESEDLWQDPGAFEAWSALLLETDQWAPAEP